MVPFKQRLADIYSHKCFMDEQKIEAQFGSIHYFVLKNSFPENHKKLKQDIKEHIKWRNKNRHDKFLRILQKRTYVA